MTELLSEPEEITFEFELIEVEKNENHERDVWAMDKTEQTKNAPIYKEQGNEFFKQVYFQFLPVEIITLRLTTQKLANATKKHYSVLVSTLANFMNNF